MHYHCAANVPGYLPEGDVLILSSKRAAAEWVATEARRYRDEQWDIPRADRRVGHGSGASGYIHFERPSDSYDLGISFWWSACPATDCDIEGDD